MMAGKTKGRTMTKTRTVALLESEVNDYCEWLETEGRRVVSIRRGTRNRNYVSVTFEYEGRKFENENARIDSNDRMWRIDDTCELAEALGKHHAVDETGTIWMIGPDQNVLVRKRWVIG